MLDLDKWKRIEIEATQLYAEYKLDKIRMKLKLKTLQMVIE